MENIVLSVYIGFLINFFYEGFLIIFIFYKSFWFMSIFLFVFCIFSFSVFKFEKNLLIDIMLECYIFFENDYYIYINIYN